MDNLTKSTQDITSFGHGNVEAMMRSSQVWAAGLQSLSQSMTEAAQARIDQTLSTWKALSNVRSVKDALELQSSLARSSFEAALSQTGKLTEASIKLAEQTMAPITARISLAVEKFTPQIN